MTQLREERIETTGGLNLFVRSWRPEIEPRGVVVIVPGFNAHSAYYGWVAQRLTSDGLAVYAIDLRGRGKSDGERFYVEKFTDYLSDVESVMKLVRSREQDPPVVLLGHSAGGVVSCLYAAQERISKNHAALTDLARYG